MPSQLTCPCRLYSCLPVRISSHHPYFLHKLYSQPFDLVPSYPFQISLDLASSCPLKSATGLLLWFRSQATFYIQPSNLDSVIFQPDPTCYGKLYPLLTYVASSATKFSRIHMRGKCARQLIKGHGAGGMKNHMSKI